jgi:hypothetical protein
LSLPLKVVKRDGRVVDFDAGRIREAVRKAMLSRGLLMKPGLMRLLVQFYGGFQRGLGLRRYPMLRRYRTL